MGRTPKTRVMKRKEHASAQRGCTTIGYPSGHEVKRTRLQYVCVCACIKREKKKRTKNFYVATLNGAYLRARRWVSKNAKNEMNITYTNEYARRDVYRRIEIILK